jgi:hypothetical protein
MSKTNKNGWLQYDTLTYKTEFNRNRSGKSKPGQGWIHYTVQDSKFIFEQKTRDMQMYGYVLGVVVGGAGRVNQAKFNLGIRD